MLEVGWGCSSVAQVKGLMHSSGDRTEVGVAAATKADDFTTNTVLLSGEFEGDKGSREEKIRGTGELVLLNATKKEFNVTKSEWLSIRGGTRVFAGAEKKKECRLPSQCRYSLPRQ